jgi:type VI secretion system protein ImpE
LNGKPFATIRDQDPQIGANLEVFAAGTYLWVPFEYIESVNIQPGRRLRERLWAPAVVTVSPEFQESEMGEVLIPAIYPFSWKLEDETVWLGRETAWAADDEGHEFPVGQRIFLVDEEEVPLFDVETISFPGAAANVTA